MIILFEKKEYDKIIEIFSKKYLKEKSIWGQCLRLFLQYLKVKDEQQNNLLQKSFKNFLAILLKRDIIPPFEILELINGINNEISIELIKDFFIDVIDKENNDLVNNLVKSKEYEVNIQELDEDIINTKEKPINISLTKCDECNIGIDYPVILFRCGHYYHILCLSYYSKDMKNSHCPKCSEFRKKIYMKDLESEKIYNLLNNEESFNKELNKYDNHLDILNALYSKGIFKNINKKEIYNK